jgi:integrase/recombinase XerD
MGGKGPAQPMQRDAASGMSLYGPGGRRKYLTAAERRRFVRALQRAKPDVRLFCLLLVWSGGRLSETLAVTADSFDLDSGLVAFETLKRRKRGVIRQVPLPPALLRDCQRVFGLRRRQRDLSRSRKRLWCWSRTTGWRRLKEIMAAARIHGLQAMPKALRHTFGVSAFLASVPPHLVQRWLGHASLKTTAIYGEVSGAEERKFAERMWKRHTKR